MQYRLSKQAECDLEDIFIDGILTFGKIQALKYHESFKRIFELIAYMPEIGRRVRSSFKSKARRRFMHGSHVIFYSIGQDHITITTIVHGACIKDIWNDI